VASLCHQFKHKKNLTLAGHVLKFYFLPGFNRTIGKNRQNLSKISLIIKIKLFGKVIVKGTLRMHVMKIGAVFLRLPFTDTKTSDKIII
jgi:hypothetical protein